ncbi:MAG: rRNA methyltransferase [Polaromonas sp.]|nr:rRNA methyltransferase [Polaromonas sp.]
MSSPLHITSRDNPLLKRLRQIAHDATAYRKHGQVWLEGDHLCRAALARGLQPVVAVFSESNWPSSHIDIDVSAIKTVIVPDALMRDITTLETLPNVGFVLDWPASPTLQAGAATLVLDRVQDAGNVGSMLRCAAAFGYRQVLAVKGTAALWSGKVLRAGMGAHFGLSLLEGVGVADVRALTVPVLVTSSHQGEWLHQAQLPWPCAWVMGHEGQGVSPELMGLASHQVRIAQPGGEESLNVAAAAAICLHSSVARA